MIRVAPVQSDHLSQSPLDSADLPLYSDFLDLISDRDVYDVHTVKEYDSAYDPDKINILFRHDVDYADGLDMVQMDYRMGFRSTNYLRVYSDLIPSAPPEYLIQDVATMWQWFVEHGSMEIGYHYDVMDETTDGFTRPADVDMARELFGQNIAFLRQYFDIETVSAHGGTYNYLYESGDFEREENLTPFGVVSAEYLPFTAFAPTEYSFLSDVDGQLDYLRENLDILIPGDVVQILIHPFDPRWVVSPFVDPTAGPQTTTQAVQMVTTPPSTLPSTEPTSGPSADSVTRNLQPMATEPSGAAGLSPLLGLLALGPAALLTVAVWRYRRLAGRNSQG